VEPPSQQLSFGELFDAPPSRRLFFGIWPDERTAESLRRLMARLRRDGVMSGRPVDTDRLHLTLHHLGDFADQIPQSLLPAAQEAAATVRSEPFDVVFDHIGGTRDQFLLQASDKLAALRDFRQALTNALVKAGLRRHIAMTFHPHVTLSYDFSNVPEMPIQPISWRVRDFVLIESLLGQHKHIRRGVWPL
jgi:2'-5' RNA ligase